MLRKNFHLFVLILEFGLTLPASAQFDNAELSFPSNLTDGLHVIGNSNNQNEESLPEHGTELSGNPVDRLLGSLGGTGKPPSGGSGSVNQALQAINTFISLMMNLKNSFVANFNQLTEDIEAIQENQGDPAAQLEQATPFIDNLISAEKSVIKNLAGLVNVIKVILKVPLPPIKMIIKGFEPYIEIFPEVVAVYNNLIPDTENVKSLLSYIIPQIKETKSTVINLPEKMFQEGNKTFVSLVANVKKISTVLKTVLEENNDTSLPILNDLSKVMKVISSQFLIYTNIISEFMDDMEPHPSNNGSISIDMAPAMNNLSPNLTKIVASFSIFNGVFDPLLKLTAAL